MMSASTGFSMSGTHTSAPVAFATGATAPTWSKWVCVRRMPSSVRFSSSRALRSFGASSPGSMIRALSEPSRPKMYVSSATGPTVNIRTSMRLRLAPALLLLPLAAAPQSAVGVVAHRHVEDHRDQAEEDARRDVLLDHADEDREDHGGERGAVQRAAPGGLLVELRLTPLAGLRSGVALRGRAAAGRAAGAPGALDRARLGAAVLTPALLLRLCHGRARSLTPSRWSGSGLAGGRPGRPPALARQARRPRSPRGPSPGRPAPREAPRDGHGHSSTPARSPCSAGGARSPSPQGAHRRTRAAPRRSSWPGSCHPWPDRR